MFPLVPYSLMYWWSNWCPLWHSSCWSYPGA